MLRANGFNTSVGGIMKWLLGWFLAFCLLMWGAVELGSAMAKAAKEGEQEKEQCIVWKHEKNAQKFLDNECNRYVRWTQ